MLEKVGANRKFDVNKLAKAKYQDNLETIQWLKRYLEKTATKVEDYNPVARRNGETLFSHHAQKNSFVNKPGKLANCTSNNLGSTMKKSLANQENKKGEDKLDQVKRILGLKESNDVKVFLIGNVVGVKEGESVLQEKAVNENPPEAMEGEEVF